MLLDWRGPRVTAVAAYTVVAVGVVLAGLAERTGPSPARLHALQPHDVIRRRGVLADALYAVGFGVMAVGCSTGYIAVRARLCAPRRVSRAYALCLCADRPVSIHCA
jgi:hypothetical protein